MCSTNKTLLLKTIVNKNKDIFGNILGIWYSERLPVISQKSNSDD